MALPVILEKQAAADAERAMAWYNARQPGLGHEFLIELARALNRVAQFPQSYQYFRKTLRRALLHRFAYVVYRISTSYIEIVAVMHCRKHPNRIKETKGFSLIEMAIVLVIIGLLASSILVGRNLIHAAQIRATVAQLDKLNTAVGAFKQKYGYLPGDMASTAAATYGFWNATGANASATGFGDGNGLLEGCAAASVNGCGETLAFFRHLTDASLVDGNYGDAIAGNAINPASGQPAAAIPAAAASTLFPVARLGGGNYVVVYSSGGVNSFEITGIQAMTTSGAFTQLYELSPEDTFSMDTKMDDGLPLLGNVTAMSSSGIGVLATPGAANCVNGISQYNLASPYGPGMLCALSTRFTN